MKKLLLFLVVFAAMGGSAFGQGARFTSQVSNQGTIGTATNAVVLPANPVINFCKSPASGNPCTNKATTYTDATLTTACATSTQIVLDGTSTCVVSPDAQNNWGVWVPAGQYTYTVTIGANNFGPYFVTAGIVGGGAGAATACSPAGLQAALAAAGPGNLVDASACLGVVTAQITNTTGSIIIPAGVRLKLGFSTWTCSITSPSTPCWWVQGGQSAFTGAGAGPNGGPNSSGPGSPGQDPSNTSAFGATNLLCSSCGTTTDMVRVSIPVGSRTSLGGSILASTEIGGFWINMGSSGRDAVYGTSVHWSSFHDLQGFNLTANGFHLEGDLVSPNNAAESYQDTVERIVMQPLNSNSTGAACYLDAQNGEIAWSRFATLRCSGNISNGGGLAGLYMQAGSATNQSIDNLIITNSYLANPKNTASSWGVRMEAPGTYTTQSGGRILQIQFVGILTERLTGPSAGTAMGCTSSGTPSGTGCGAITRMNSAYTANWTTTLDRPNMGQGFSDVSDASTPGSGAATYRADGTTFGNNASAFADTATHFAGLNSDTLLGGTFQPKFHDNGKTTLSAFGLNIAPTLAAGGVAGNFSIWEALHVDGSGIASGIGFHVANSHALFDGTIKFTEGAGPSGVAGQDNCAGVTATHTLNCIFNNGTSFPMTQTIGTGNVTTAGTAVNTLTCQAQTNITVSGALASDNVVANIGATLPATWQTGIVLSAHVTASNTVTVYLCNPTATATITPAATQVNVRVTR